MIAIHFPLGYLKATGETSIWTLAQTKQVPQTEDPGASGQAKGIRTWEYQLKLGV